MHLRGLDFTATIRFIDSISFTPMPLRDLPKTFGLTEIAKGYFPQAPLPSLLLFMTLAWALSMTGSWICMTRWRASTLAVRKHLKTVNLFLDVGLAASKKWLRGQLYCSSDINMSIFQWACVIGYNFAHLNILVHARQYVNENHKSYARVLLFVLFQLRKSY